MTLTALDVMGRVLRYSKDIPATKQIADLFSGCAEQFKADKLAEYTRLGFVLFYLTLDGNQQEQYIRNAFDSVGQVAADIKQVGAISEYEELPASAQISDHITHDGPDD